MFRLEYESIILLSLLHLILHELPATLEGRAVAIGQSIDTQIWSLNSTLPVTFQGNEEHSMSVNPLDDPGDEAKRG